jgi:hypothetical protein
MPVTVSVIDGVPVGGGGGVTGLRLKDAPTLVAVFIATTQDPVPLQAPLQPANVEPEAAVAVSATLVPVVKLALHVAPQLMPAGELTTEPVPVPLVATVSVCCMGGGGGGAPPKLALTASAPFTVSVQVGDVPEHAPPQPENAVPFWPRAVSVITVPAG